MRDRIGRWLEGLPPLRRRLLVYLFFGGGGAWFASKTVLAFQSGVIKTRSGQTIQRAMNPDAFQFEMYWQGAIATLALGMFAFFVFKDIKRRNSK